MTIYQLIIPFAIGAAGCLMIHIHARQPKKRNSTVTFNEHVQEIRDLINRCDDKSEWNVLDMEIDYLEQTWRGRVDAAVLIMETGALYDKWYTRGNQLDELRKTNIIQYL
jgi:hypothetical protein